jgi:hypothetical protein
MGQFHNQPDFATEAVNLSTSAPSADISVDQMCLYVGGAGDVVVNLINSTTDITFASVAAGTFLPVVVDKIKAATTASKIIGYK